MGGISWKEAQLLPSKMAYLKLLLLLVPGILGQTHFKKCGSDLCFEAKVKEIVVQIGKNKTDGTDDDVTVEFCGDVDASQCCTTPVLKSRNPLVDDWSKGDTETYKASKYGKCKDQVYKIRQNLRVTLKKSEKKKDNLVVDLIDVYLISADKKVKDDKKPILERFQCKNYKLGGTDLPQQTKNCVTGPYHYEKIEKAVFTIDNNKTDGTDNDVKFKIEADANNVTCETALDQFGDDWHYGKTEIWTNNKFGSCKSKLYKVNDAPTFSIIKTGKDDLKVKSAFFYMRRLDLGKTTKYDCGKFELKGDCNKLPCIKKFSNCKACTVGTGKCKDNSAKPAAKPKATTTTTKKPKSGGGLLSKIKGALG